MSLLDTRENVYLCERCDIFLFESELENDDCFCKSKRVYLYACKGEHYMVWKKNRGKIKDGSKSN